MSRRKAISNIQDLRCHQLAQRMKQQGLPDHYVQDLQQQVAEIYANATLSKKDRNRRLRETLANGECTIMEYRVNWLGLEAEED